MEQLDLEDYIEEKKLEEKKKPKWVSSSYKPIERGDLVEYHFAPGADAWGRPTGGKKRIGLVLEVYPANVYDPASCEILERNGNVSMIETKWVRKVT